MYVVSVHWFIEMNDRFVNFDYVFHVLLVFSPKLNYRWAKAQPVLSQYSRISDKWQKRDFNVGIGAHSNIYSIWILFFDSSPLWRGKEQLNAHYSTKLWLKVIKNRLFKWTLTHTHTHISIQAYTEKKKKNTHNPTEIQI